MTGDPVEEVHRGDEQLGALRELLAADAQGCGGGRQRRDLGGGLDAGVEGAERLDSLEADETVGDHTRAGEEPRDRLEVWAVHRPHRGGGVTVQLGIGEPGGDVDLCEVVVDALVVVEERQVPGVRHRERWRLGRQHEVEPRRVEALEALEHRRVGEELPVAGPARGLDVETTHTGADPVTSHRERLDGVPGGDQPGHHPVDDVLETAAHAEVGLRESHPEAARHRAGSPALVAITA